MMDEMLKTKIEQMFLLLVSIRCDFARLSKSRGGERLDPTWDEFMVFVHVALAEKIAGYGFIDKPLPFEINFDAQTLGDLQHPALLEALWENPRGVEYIWGFLRASEEAYRDGDGGERPD